MTASPPPVWRTSAGAATLLGLVVPGLGHVYLGRYGKALLFFGVILSTYTFGLWLADWRCVNYDRYQVWFFAQAFAAGPTALTAWLTREMDVTRVIPQFDVGQLYVGVAALLNAVAVADSIGCAREALDERVFHLEAARDMERAAALEVAAPAPPPAAEIPSVSAAPPEPAAAPPATEVAAAPDTNSWLFEAPPAGPVAPPPPPPPPHEGEPLP